MNDDFEYNLDIVFVLDATESMSPLLHEMKQVVVDLHERILATLYEKDKYVSELRAKLVIFRDLVDYPHDALAETRFYSLPHEDAAFRAQVGDIEARGGGFAPPGQDEPESGLEALGLAITSDWTRKGSRRRHLVVLFTDASAYNLEQTAQLLSRASKRDRRTYETLYPMQRPSGMPLPRTWQDLARTWAMAPPMGAMELEAKRLLLFTPELSPWTYMRQFFDNVIHKAVTPGQGLSDIPYDEILAAVAYSIGG